MRTDNSVGYLLQHTTDMLAKQSDQSLQEQLGIGLSQLRILRSLQAEPRTTQREIAVSLGQTEASISRQVKLLIHGGLLQSLRSTKDRREHITMLTPKGARLTEAAVDVLNAHHMPLFATLGDKQLAQFEASLRVLHNAVCSVVHSD